MSDLRCWLIHDGKRFKCAPPYPEADHAVVEGACPECKIDPLKIVGKNNHVTADDRAWEADGFCLSCERPVGLIRFEPETLFGIHEDIAVLNGRPRVY